MNVYTEIDDYAFRLVITYDSGISYEDINEDGKVDVSDVLLCLRKAIGLE